MDDDELIARVAGGDDVALRELLFRHGPWLAARLRRVLPADDVEDVLQETFLAVWRGARGYRPEGASGAWLWGIARRQAFTLLRHGGPASSAVSELLVGHSGGDADPALAALSHAELEEAVEALGPPGSPERELWRLLYVEDRPVTEVAKLMGVPVGTVKSRAHRVRQVLREALGSHPAAEGGSR
jgi:RNA polymerase sigma-70 factor (ECF subfamily)